MKYNESNKKYNTFKEKYDKFENKYYDEIQEYKLFKKENFVGVDKFINRMKKILQTIIIIFSLFSIAVVTIGLIMWLTLIKVI